MTAKEAIQTIKAAKAEVEWNYPLDYAAAFEMTIKAVEKQIPYKLEPIASVKAHVPVCGKCRGVMDLMQGELNYCPNCGQRLDWGDEE